MAVTETRRLRGGGWVRETFGDYGERVASLFVAGPDDDTPSHLTYPTGYDGACGWCWLNANHSDAAHAAKLEEADR